MKAGFVAIIGSANAGKSTLLNTLLGEKVAIVSRKPQTTRENITGVYNKEDCQIVFIDTPGLHRAKNALGDYMTKCVMSAANSVDCILLVLDCTKGVRDRELINIAEYQKNGLPVVIALNKADLLDKVQLLPMLETLAATGVAAVVPISGLKNDNLDALIGELKRHLTSEDALYPEDVLTDRSDRYMVAELIREKILTRYDDEIPHGICVCLNKFEYHADRKLYEIDADVVCEKQGHKAIIIGKQGEALKNVATKARLELEKYFDCKVFLTLWVRVREDWRDKPSMLTQFGYDKKQLN